ncbi:hypothetical protein [Oryzobacter telluris]|uniref:hypothetical protein n=1 Tax=Oryzobacter telluris TaxID=3149179 RepID=UPI00370D70AD
MAKRRDINELFQWLDRPIFWDPVPDWLNERFDDRIRTEFLLKDLEMQRVVLEKQLETLTVKIDLIQKTIGG